MLYLPLPDDWSSAGHTLYLVLLPGNCHMKYNSQSGQALMMIAVGIKAIKFIENSNWSRMKVVSRSCLTYNDNR